MRYIIRHLANWKVMDRRLTGRLRVAMKTWETSRSRLPLVQITYAFPFNFICHQRPPGFLMPLTRTDFIS